MPELTYDVLVLDGTPRSGDMRLPSGESIVSSPLSVTLVQGSSDAVLVDAPYTYGQVERVRDWIRDSGRNLIAVYITHAHGDHWLGVHELLREFGDVPVYTTAGPLSRMPGEATEGRDRLWDRVFGGLIPPSPVIAQLFPTDGLQLEGHDLVPVDLGHTDTADTTALWVPDLRLLLAGDSVYNGVHQYVLETPDGGFDSWLAALDTIAALEPAFVVAGHKAPGSDDDPRCIAETRDYLVFARELLATVDRPDEYYKRMLRRYPKRVNAGPVWYCALGLLTDR